eukprot:scaffold10958_cov23-Cyclotella_meneghiniana.AAC.3
MRGVIRFGGGEVVAPDHGPKPALEFLTNGVAEVRINTNVNAVTKPWQNDAIFYDDGTLCIPIYYLLVMKFALMKIRKHS